MRKFRRKYFDGHCPKCKRKRKLIFVGEEQEMGVVWMKCSKCLETRAYPEERVRKTGRVLTKAELTKRNAAMVDVKDYSPDGTYWVGQKIRHPEFEEVGEVLSKEETAGGHQMIVVKFPNQGKKKLVESFETS